VIDLDPKAVVIMIGANDLAEKAGGEIVFGNVKRIIEALKGHSTTMPIMLCETFPCSPDAYRPVAEIRKINALYAETWADDPQVILTKTYAVIAGIRLITDDAQLDLTTLPGPSQKVTFVTPGPMSDAERAALLVDHTSAK